MVIKIKGYAMVIFPQNKIVIFPQKKPPKPPLPPKKKNKKKNKQNTAFLNQPQIQNYYEYTIFTLI